MELGGKVVTGKNETVAYPGIFLEGGGRFNTLN
jgi:hypothetical protein